MKSNRSGTTKVMPAPKKVLPAAGTGYHSRKSMKADGKTRNNLKQATEESSDNISKNIP